MRTIHGTPPRVIRFLSCHIVSGLFMLTMGLVILCLQCLFWIHFAHDPRWCWPDQVSLFGFGTSAMLIVHAVFLFLTSALRSRRMLVTVLIFGCISVFFFLAVGVKHVLEYRSFVDTKPSSLITITVGSLISGAYVFAYMFVVSADLCCSHTRNAHHESTVLQDNPTRRQLESHSVHVANSRSLQSLLQTSTNQGTPASHLPYYPLPSAPVEPPPYKP